MSRELVSIRFEWKPQDCWIGAFWKRKQMRWGDMAQTDLWLCIVPMFPLHICWLWRKKGAGWR